MAHGRKPPNVVLVEQDGRLVAATEEATSPMSHEELMELIDEAREWPRPDQQEARGRRRLAAPAYAGRGVPPSPLGSDAPARRPSSPATITCTRAKNAS